jgi:hypothetical protein
LHCWRICVLILFVNETARLSPPDRFNSLIEGLFGDMTTRAANGSVEWPLNLVLIKLIWRRLRRMSRRFAAILARLQAGTLVEARRAPGRAARTAGSWRWVGLSQCSGWVIHAVSWFVMMRHYELEEMLEDPETAALVAEAPQLGSVLRPLCRMLAVTPPAWLKLPRRARAPRVAKTIPPAPEWLLEGPHKVVRADGSVWMHLGSSTHWKPGDELTLEQARKFDPPIRIWPRDD